LSGQVRTVSPEIRVSSTREQVRRVENKKAEFTRCRPDEPSLCTEKIRQMNHTFDQPERVHDAGVSRHDGADLDALRFQGDRKSAGNVGKFTDLDQGKYL
jgi:hypothetical protein